MFDEPGVLLPGIIDGRYPPSFIACESVSEPIDRWIALPAPGTAEKPSALAPALLASIVELPPSE